MLTSKLKIDNYNTPIFFLAAAEVFLHSKPSLYPSLLKFFFFSALN